MSSSKFVFVRNQLLSDQFKLCYESTLYLLNYIEFMNSKTDYKSNSIFFITYFLRQINKISSNNNTNPVKPPKSKVMRKQAEKNLRNSLSTRK